MITRTNLLNALIALFAIFCFACTSMIEAAPVDFALIDIGPTGQRVETVAGPGIGLPAAPAANTNNTNYPANVLSAQTGDLFTFAIDNVDTTGSTVGGIDWRDRGDSANGAQALVLTGEDFVKNNGGVVRVTLGGLPAGDYGVTSYHIDAGFTQSGQIDVQASTDGGGSYSGVLASGNANLSAGGVNGLTTAIVNQSSASFGFTADGANDVQLVFDGRPFPDSELPLNGLAITYDAGAAVPEPSTFILATLGLIAVGLIGWRRR